MVKGKEIYIFIIALGISIRQCGTNIENKWNFREGDHD